MEAIRNLEIEDPFTTEVVAVDIPSLIRQLADKRNKLTAAKQTTNELLERFREAYSAEFDIESVLADEIKELESNIRTCVEAEFKTTANKQPYAGVTVKEIKKYPYDPDKAFEWCKENAKACILPESLDTKAFGEIVKSDKLRPDFVTSDKVPQVQIDKDLNKALGV